MKKKTTTKEMNKTLQHTRYLTVFLIKTVMNKIKEIMNVLCLQSTGTMETIKH